MLFKPYAMFCGVGVGGGAGAGGPALCHVAGGPVCHLLASCLDVQYSHHRNMQKCHTLLYPTVYSLNLLFFVTLVSSVEHIFSLTTFLSI